MKNVDPDLFSYHVCSLNFSVWRYHGLINKVYVTYYIEMILEGILQKDSTKKLQWCTFSTITLYLSFSETITVVLTFLFLLQNCYSQLNSRACYEELCYTYIFKGPMSPVIIVESLYKMYSFLRPWPSQWFTIFLVTI